MSNHSLRYRPGRGIHIVVEQAQPTTERMTVHGTSAHVEADPNGGIVVSKFGWGTVVEGGGGALIWVHFAVPTPMVGKTTWLREIFFWFRADGPSLRHIHVYDGRSRIRHFDIHASGDMQTIWLTARTPSRCRTPSAVPLGCRSVFRCPFSLEARPSSAVCHPR